VAAALQSVETVRILVSNDDGIYSPGLCALAEVASEFGGVRIVAPDVEQSSMGHAITPSRPLSYRATKIKGVEAYRVNGTPADCVALGAYNWDRVGTDRSAVERGWVSLTPLRLDLTDEAELASARALFHGTEARGGEDRARGRSERRAGRKARHRPKPRRPASALA
jgi:broad specificity polyphosphatase/5'/3'-nucleotidase SurE